MGNAARVTKSLDEDEMEFLQGTLVVTGTFVLFAYNSRIRPNVHVTASDVAAFF